MPRFGHPRIHSLGGYLEQHALASLLAGCDAFVHAGNKETFGLVILEAMASGLPVVGVTGGAVEELVQRETGYLAPPNHPRALAEAIETLFQNDVAQMGREARALVMQRWSWANSFSTLQSHYQQLLGVATNTAEPRRYVRR